MPNDPLRDILSDLVQTYGVDRVVAAVHALGIGDALTTADPVFRAQLQDLITRSSRYFQAGT